MPNATPDPASRQTAPNANSAIRTEHVVRSYAMGDAVVRAVDGVTITIDAGEFVALLGSSGSGKSTLLNLLAGLDRPTSGAIYAHGKNLADMDSEELARHRSLTVGMVFQAFNLLPRMTLEENVELPLRLAEVDRAERPARVREAVDRVRLTARLSHRPSELSGGEQQRASLARALVNRPTILLADEPTGNLDSRTGDTIMDLLTEINRTLKMTIVMVTHDQRARGTLRAEDYHHGRREIGERRGARMKTRDLTELAARNLREALLRNSLTTLGIAVGVASLVAMLSLGVGLQELASSRLANSGLFDAVIVMSKSTMRGFGPPTGADAAADAKPARRLDEDARTQLAALPNVVEVYPEVRFPTEIVFDGKPFSTSAAGIPQSAKKDGAYEGMRGTFFSAPDAPEAILQIELAKQLSPDTDSLIGKEVSLRYAERHSLAPDATTSADGNAAAKSGGAAADAGADDEGAGFSVVTREKKLKIVGVVETEPAAGFGGFGRGRLLIPLAVASNLKIAQPTDMREMLRGQNGKTSYDSLTVRVKNPAVVQQVEDAVKDMGFGTFSILDATKNIRLVFIVFDSLLGIFGSLALTVASLGIINTLVMAILERRREIGILKALGAADRDVRGLFFAEAGVMGLFGGIVGVGLGWAIGRALNFATNIYLKKQGLPAIDLSSVPLWLVGAAIGFAFVVSMLAGIYPASRAAKLNPVEALRYE